MQKSEPKISSIADLFEGGGEEDTSDSSAFTGKAVACEVDGLSSSVDRGLSFCNISNDKDNNIVRIMV